LCRRPAPRPPATTAAPHVRDLWNSILSALASLHAQGLFHGHVTPGRILFSSPSHNELGAATAKLCYLEKAHGAGDAWQAGGTPVGTVDKDLRDADIVSLGLTVFAALMGDSGAAAGEPLESYRATTESTGVPELSPLGRQVDRDTASIDLMLGTDPGMAIPSAVELLQHPWFPSDGAEEEEPMPLPLAPGQTVAVGPPAKPEDIPAGLPPTVPKLGGTGNGLGDSSGSLKKAGLGGSLSRASSSTDESSLYIDMPDGSKALAAWLAKKTSGRKTLAMKSSWQRRWFVLNPSTSMLLIYTREVDLTASEPEASRRSSGGIPKAFPLDGAHVSPLVRPGVRDNSSSHAFCLVLEDEAERFPSMFLSFKSEKLMHVWLIAFQSVAEVRAAGTRGSGNHSSHADGMGRGSADAGGEGLGWWDDVSHQAQRVAHVTAASAFACGGGEAELSRFVEEKLVMHKRSARSLYLNGSMKSGGTSLFGGGGSMVLPTANNAGTIFKNSALQWEHRVQELAAVTAGKPITSPMQPGERWFIVDARWMDHWLEFCTSKRRMSPPGPIDNSWMLHSEKRHIPYEGLTLAMGKQAGDYRRVGMECWDQLMRLYGGGPAIYVDGPPVEDLSRWVVRFGHQVSAKSTYRTKRHIPNPNISVKSLEAAAMKWVMGWDNEEDDDGDDDYESARGSQDDSTLLTPVSDGQLLSRRAGSERGAPLSVLREEDGQGSVSPTGSLNSIDEADMYG
ncbi:unnamed protein product, partial [Ectocarpus sp. 6 AP-2014]